MITAFTPATFFSMAAAAAFASQVSALEGPRPDLANTQVLQPPLIQETILTAQVVPVDAVAGYEETCYLESIPGVAASIRQGLSTPVSELNEIDVTCLLEIL